MSQAGRFIPGTGAPPVETITGNTGGPVGPDGSGNINLLGTGVVLVTGDPGTDTLTISVDDTVATTFTTDSGVATPVANNIDIIGGTGITTSAVGDTIIITNSGSAGIIQLDGDTGTASGASVLVAGGNNIVTTGNNASTLTIDLNGTTNHAVQIGNSSGSLTSLAAASNGQLVIGSTGADPVVAALSAGTNVSITNGAGSITVAASQAQILTQYRVANASPFVVNSTDFYITVDTTTIPITIQFPDAPTTYRRFVVKDSGGLASVNNITITTVSGLLNIDAATTFVMNTNYQAIELMYSGFGYEIF